MTEENIYESLPAEESAPNPIAELVPDLVQSVVPDPVLDPNVATLTTAVAPSHPAPAPALQAAAVPEPLPEPLEDEPTESFADLFRDFERSHSHKSAPGAKQLQGTVISISAEQVFLDIGYKTEGVLPRSAFENNAEGVKPGDTVPRLRHRPQRGTLLRALTIQGGATPRLDCS